MKRYTLLYIVGVLCTFMNLSWAYASNPVKEGNVITGHVIEKGSEAGIAYATVLIVETGKGTVTNDEMMKVISVSRIFLRENIP